MKHLHIIMHITPAPFSALSSNASEQSLLTAAPCYHQISMLASCFDTDHVFFTCCESPVYVLQVFSQPLFENAESIMTEHQIWPSKQPRLMRAILRSLYVVITAFVAVCIPFFADLMGLIGSAGFTPLTFIIPCVLWLKVRLHCSSTGIISVIC